MPANREGPAPLFEPSDVARVLGKSAWWVKDQARKGLIPFTRPGRAYRFTAEQVAEIVQLYSQPVSAVTQLVAHPKPVRSDKPAALKPKPAVRLHARPPRRTAQTAPQQSEAA
ncbi:helix-turn-helix domain-containing protein [Kitasatospora sp. NPDC058032]|uniref:helix-turn-helix domain-containing protein n=1 Tax=Kitasatospora sp. NPDC058032 TaxID=3346307 RepID=UPI0036D8DA75